MTIPLDDIHLVRNKDGTYSLTSKFNYADIKSIDNTVSTGDCIITIPKLKLNFKNLPNTSNEFLVSVEILSKDIS